MKQGLLSPISRSMSEAKARKSIDPSSIHPDSDVSSLIPLCPGFPIKVKKKDRVDKTSDIFSLVSRNGGRTHDFNYEIYDRRMLDRFRDPDNVDMLTGRKGVIFDDVPHLRQIHSEVGSLVKKVLPDLLERENGGDMIASMERQDMRKISLQRCYSLQSRFDLHFVDGIKRDAYPPLYKAIVEAVLDRYVEMAGDTARLGSSRLRLLDSDPPDTSLGLFPTVKDGETHAGRVMMLTAVNFERGPAYMFESMSRLAVEMGLPDWAGVAIKKAYRHRTVAGDKEVDIYYFNGSEYISDHSAVSLLDPGRSVYQFSYAINYVMSPLYLFFKGARQRMRGMYHTNDMLLDTVKALKSDYEGGRIPYAVDQSGQDKHIGPHFFDIVANHLSKRGVLKEECDLLRQLPKNTTTLIPHPHGPSRGSLAVTGISGMPSGLKLTSEIDTLHNLCSSLYVMEHVEPGATRRWLSGKLIYPAQGDDGLMMIRPQDEKKVAVAVEQAEKDLGIELKMFRDALFLKKMLPLDKRLTMMVRPVSRVIQNTLFNEDNYDGVKGGVTPDAILRLGLCSRCENIKHNPYAKEIWSSVVPIVESLSFMKRSPDKFRSAFKNMEPVLLDEDHEEIQLYAERVPNYAERLVERAGYDPSAMNILEYLRARGIDFRSSIKPNSQIRSLYENALKQKPSFGDTRTLMASTSWLRGE